MWDHLTPDEVSRRATALERYAAAGVPDAGAAFGAYLMLNGDHSGALDWWMRFTEPSADGTPEKYFFPFGRTIQTRDNGYGGMFGGPARYPRTRIDALGKFAADSDPDIRMEVASNPAAPEALLRTLASDPEYSVREDVVVNPMCPPDILAALQWSTAAEEYGETPAVTWGAIARNPRCPAEVLQAYIDYESEFDEDYEDFEDDLDISYSDYLLDVLSSVAGNYGLSNEMIELLSSHHQPLVRGAIASNPVTPIYVVQALATDPDSSVRIQAASNLGLSSADYSTLSVDPEPRVRAAVAANPAASEEIRATAALGGN